MFKPELLAPAGDLERLKIALLYGADAVYLGGRFSLRANASNFTIEDIKEGVEYAHKLNKKVYVTVNIALHNEELKQIREYLESLDQIGVDAIIVSDPSIIEIAKAHTNLEIHLSTQNSSLNKEAVEFWKNEGISRVVLARETSKEEMEDIKKLDIELEVFIHGAMCASYSGRCVLSNLFTGRDANRGGCAQICRWDFDLLDENNNEIKGEKPFTFCTKDLSLLKHIPELVDLEIDSLKIEGRMRSIYYLATVVSTYRKVIDEYCNNKEKYEYNLKYEQILRRCANRDSVPQFFNGIFDKNMQYYNGRMEVSNQDFIGLILDYKDGYAKIEQRNYFKKGDKVTIFGPDEEFSFVIEEILDEEKNPIEIVRHPKQIVYVRVPKKVSVNNMMKIY